MEPLRIGIVGCGSISGIHGAMLQKLEKEGVARLVAATDVIPERAQKFTSNYGGEPVESYESLLRRSDVDSITICTPSGLHGEMAILAAQAGKHALSEKPLDIRVEQVDKAIAAAAAAGTVYGGIFQERFTTAAQKVKRAIDAGAFGEIVLACAETKWYRTQQYYDSGAWRGTWALDCGVFSNQGIHSLDKVQWLAGEVVEVISATLQLGYKRDIESETNGVCTVRFANGAIGTIAMTTLSYPGFAERIDVSGTRGSAMLVGDKLAHFSTEEPFEPEAAAGAETQASASDATRASDPLALGEGHNANIRDFFMAIHEKRSPLVPASEARRAVNLLNMIYRKAGVGPFA